MAFATGSGDYIALMSAVLAFAIADGWSTTGGNWPISKGNVRGVDWSTVIASETDFTALGGGNRNNRIIRLATGTSPANATANAGLDTIASARLPNMDRTFTNWWIFSDSGLGKPDHVHVVVRFSNGPNPDCFSHFSFGEVDRHGMTHGPISYAATSPLRAYALNLASGISAGDWNGGAYRRGLRPFTGQLDFSFTKSYYLNNLSFICSTPSVFPTSPSGFPSIDTVFDSSRMMDTYGPASGSINFYDRIASRTVVGGNPKNFSLSAFFPMALPQPYSGAIGLGPLPIIVLNGTVNSSNGVLIGSFPNVRICSMEGYNPGDEVTFGSDTWVLFPMLRKTPNSLVHSAGVVTSGSIGFAYKKVV